MAGGVCTIRCHGLRFQIVPAEAPAAHRARRRQLGPGYLGHGELPVRGPMFRVAVLDQAHRRKGAAVEAATGRWSVLVNGAALRAEVRAGPVRAAPECQFAITVPFGQEVGQAFPITLLVYRDALVIAASRTAGARGPASPRHQAARKSNSEQFIERSGSFIADSPLPAPCLTKAGELPFRLQPPRYHSTLR